MLCCALVSWLMLLHARQQRNNASKLRTSVVMLKVMMGSSLLGQKLQSEVNTANIFCVVFTKNIVIFLLKINCVSILPQITSKRKNTFAYLKHVNFGKSVSKILCDENTATNLPRDEITGNRPAGAGICLVENEH